MKKSGEWALINSLLLAKTLRSLPKLRGKGPVFKIFSKGAGSEFSHKKGGVGKIGKVILKKGGFTYFHTDYMSLMSSFSLCVMCVYLLLIYTISINILFVSQEQLSIIRFIICVKPTTNLTHCRIKHIARSFYIATVGPSYH